jgi:hypothetical protein
LCRITVLNNIVVAMNRQNDDSKASDSSDITHTSCIFMPEGGRIRLCLPSGPGWLAPAADLDELPTVAVGRTRTLQTY